MKAFNWNYALLTVSSLKLIYQCIILFKNLTEVIFYESKSIWELRTTNGECEATKLLTLSD